MRSLWFAAGAGAGAYAVVRARRAAEALTSDGLRDRAGAWALGLRMLREEVAAGSAERQTELRERYGLVPHGRPELVVSTSSTTERRGSTTEGRGPTTEGRGPTTEGRASTTENDDPQEGRP